MRPMTAFGGDSDDDALVEDVNIETMDHLIGRPLTDEQFKYYQKRTVPVKELQVQPTWIAGL